MTTASFTYARGAPIVVDRVITDDGGLPLDELVFEMDLKAAVGNAPPPEGAPVVAPFAINFTAAAGSTPAFWRGTINPNTIDPGTYVTDGVVKHDGEILFVTDPVLIVIANSVTPG